MTGRTATQEETARWRKRPDMLVHVAEPFIAEPPLSALRTAVRTGTDTFYVRNHGPVPELDPRRWRLRVDGAVRAPATFSLAELRARFTEHRVLVTLQCAGNRRAGLLAVRDIPGEVAWGSGAISTAEFAGARLADVLAAAGARRDGHVAFEAPDVASGPGTPFGGSIPAAKAYGPEVLLAWSMNGAELPVLHGAPLRVVVPGYVGARSVKWLSRITVQDRPSENHFQSKAYRLLPPDADPSDPAGGLQLGPVALNSEIVSPADGAVLPAGESLVTGYALAGDGRAVSRVDVSVDGGETWRVAELDEPVNPWCWRFWRLPVLLPGGVCEIVARAWDSSGAAQPEHARHLWNPKGYVNNAWARVRVAVG